MTTYKHFGVNIRLGKLGPKLTRDNYAIINKKCTTHEGCDDYYNIYWGEEKRDRFLEIFEDESAKIYTNSWCVKHQERALKNFDLNMLYFNSLDHNDFLKVTNNFLHEHNEFREINDLNEADGMSGYYVMAIDGYCQMYIGTSNDIKRRIMSHWSKSKQFDRLIFGEVNSSKLSIDSFRALDTTRIFAFYTNDVYSVEDTYIKSIPDEFCCNRTGGGIPEFGAISILANAKHRNLEF